jgi:uncharacterized protein with HEPN domain
MGIQEQIEADKAAVEAAQAQLAKDQAILEAAQPHLSVIGEIEVYAQHLPEEVKAEFAALIAKARALF